MAPRIVYQRSRIRIGFSLSDENAAVAALRVPSSRLAAFLPPTFWDMHVGSCWTGGGVLLDPLFGNARRRASDPMGFWPSDCLNSCFSSPPDGNCEGTAVILNVYDLTTWNNYIHWCGIGIFHSGIEAHGLEYAFGAHALAASGVFEVEPRNCPGFTYRCSILLGYTRMHLPELREFFVQMGSDYHGDSYNLILKNCNHFTEDVCMRLTGRQIPGWVNRVAQLGAMCRCLLPPSFQTPVSKQLSEYYSYSEDESELTENDDGAAEEDDARRLLPLISLDR